MRKNPKLTLVFLIILMIITLIWGGSMLVAYFRYETVEGTVSKVESYYSSIPNQALTTGNYYTRVTVEYKVKGMSYSADFSENEKESAFYEGQKLKVYYDPVLPEKAYVAVSMNKIVIAVVFVIILGFGIFICIRYIKDGQLY